MIITQKDIENWAESNKLNCNVTLSKKTVKNETATAFKHGPGPNKNEVLNAIEKWGNNNKV